MKILGSLGLILLIFFIFCLILGITIAFYKAKTEQAKHIQKPTSHKIKSEEKSDNFNVLYKKAINDFYVAIQKYEELIHRYQYQCYQIGQYDKVYQLENSYCVYIGIDTWNGYGADTSKPRPHILIEELTNNDLFKFNATQFGKNFENPFYDIRVNRFYGIKNKYNYQKIGATKFFFVNEKLPELNLLDRTEKWEGIACHFIIVELYDEKDSAATVKYITNNNLEQEAQSLCRQIERFELKHDVINKISNTEILHKLNNMRSEFVNNKKKDNKLIWTLRGHLRYFFISEQTTDFDLQSRGAQILENYKKRMFENIEWFEYGRFDGKWKSELLVFEYCQKLYGADNVLFQYSPSFLGKMSYDVFITTKNVAIEYQGKQHFMPVDFFGGEEHYQQQIMRDERKKNLSIKNGVKLVYINYNETITEKLISERVQY